MKIMLAVFVLCGGMAVVGEESYQDAYRSGYKGGYEQANGPYSVPPIPPIPPIPAVGQSDARDGYDRGVIEGYERAQKNRGNWYHAE